MARQPTADNTRTMVTMEVEKTRRHTTGPLELRVEKRNYPKMSSRSNDYAYVNSAFVGSTNSVNQVSRVEQEPPTSVYREQYCVCSRWPFGQKILAVAVGVLIGAVIGLGVTMLIINRDPLDLPILRHSVPD